MCLILFAWDTHPKYQLILAANRDEFYDRPTARADFWENHPDILAGRDLRAGGTWMGINKNGRFTAITNYRDLSNINPDAVSRGNLTLDFLKGNEDAASYLKRVSAVRHQFNGFNLLAGNQNFLYYYSNVENEIKKLKEGIYGLSNHLLNTEWPKVRDGMKEFERNLKENTVNIPAIFEVLQNRSIAPDHELPQTGLMLDFERALSARFIATSDYGTYSATVLLIDRSGGVDFTERVYKNNNFSEQKFEFKIEQ